MCTVLRMRTEDKASTCSSPSTSYNPHYILQHIISGIVQSFRGFEVFGGCHAVVVEEVGKGCTGFQGVFRCFKRFSVVVSGCTERRLAKVAQGFRGCRGCRGFRLSIQLL